MATENVYIYTYTCMYMQPTCKYLIPGITKTFNEEYHTFTKLF